MTIIVQVKEVTASRFLPTLLAIRTAVFSVCLSKRLLLPAINASTCWSGDKIGTQFLAFAFDLSAALAGDIEPILSSHQRASSAVVGSARPPDGGSSMSTAIAVMTLCIAGVVGLAVAARLIVQKRAKPETGGLIEHRDTKTDADEAIHNDTV